MAKIMAEDIIAKTLNTYIVDIVNIKTEFKYTCDICKLENTCRIINIKYNKEEYPLTLNYNKWIMPSPPSLINSNQYFIKSDLWVCCDKCNKHIQQYIDSIVKNNTDQNMKN